jgi:hypothetical protein
MNTKLIASIAVALTLTGCVTQPKAPQNYSDYKAMTDRVYVNKTPEQVFKATETLMRLADKDTNDLTFTYDDNEIKVQRFYTIYFVIGFENGKYNFTVRTTPQGNDTRTTLSVDRFIGAFLNADKNVVTTPAYYQLFYSRLDYLLGVSKEWITCDQAKTRFGEAPRGLCFMSDDLTPVRQ